MTLSNILSLPAVALSDRGSLPIAAGLYFVVDDEGHLLYIGQADSLRRRWRGHSILRSHKGTLSRLRVAWYLTDCPQLERVRLEAALIRQYRPPANPASAATPVIPVVDGWFTTSEIAAALGVDASRIRQLISELHLSPRKVWGRLLFNADDRLRLEQRNLKPGPAPNRKHGGPEKLLAVITKRGPRAKENGK